jgi:hypothetical protein
METLSLKKLSFYGNSLPSETLFPQKLFFYRNSLAQETLLNQKPSIKKISQNLLKIQEKLLKTLPKGKI